MSINTADRQRNGGKQVVPARVIAVAGAGGYVGRALCRALVASYRVIGLTRRPEHPDIPGVEWRICDIFSALECESALDGVDTGVYLVHSMLPSARLTQGNFQDMDLILADNFARAASLNGLNRIIYLGGLLPDLPRARLSRHLHSRLEVERVLGSRDIPLTALRAGIVIGAHGSSFAILRNLVKRLPLLPCPLWGRSKIQPVALHDLVEIFKYCLEHPETTRGSFSLGGPQVMTYRELLECTALVLKKKRIFFNLPWRGSLLCKIILRLVTGAPLALVSPLVESMACDMRAGDRSLQQAAGQKGATVARAVTAALDEEAGEKRSFRKILPGAPTAYDVRSVQRLPLPPGRRAGQVVERYLAWLEEISRGLLKCRRDGQGGVRIEFGVGRARLSLLELSFSPERSPAPDRLVYFISGGILARKINPPSRRPRLELREVPGTESLLLAVHDYRPALPPLLYRHTQARLHLLGARCFARRLRKEMKAIDRTGRVG